MKGTENKKKQPLILYGIEKICFGKAGRGPAVELKVSTLAAFGMALEETLCHPDWNIQTKHAGLTKHLNVSNIFLLIKTVFIVLGFHLTLKKAVEKGSFSNTPSHRL